MYIVAKDGSGDFTTLQAAVDAVPENAHTPVIILLRMDEYHEKVVVHKNNIRIVGEARDRTVLTWNGCAKDKHPDGRDRGTFLSATLMVTGHNVEVENLTIRNDAGDGSVVGQAVAVYAAGDRDIWRNCRMIAHQDTLFCGPMEQRVVDDIRGREGSAEVVECIGDSTLTHSRQYFEDCYIQGDVDFVFGPYRCWFERCTLFMNQRGGLYTAANTPEEQPYGLVFHKCRLTGECRDGEAYLGRPWRKFCRTVFLECEMDEKVSPQGFADWDKEKPVTERCGEWRTTGVRADQSTRHPSQKRLSDEEAATLTVSSVLGGWDQWQPDRRIPTWFLCGDSIMADYPAASAPMTGWGQVLQSLLPGGVFVQNEAVNGRSSKSFVAEKRLNFIELCLRPGDKLIVSFGHNDEKSQDPARYTTARGTYPEYLGMYIDAARRQGAEPVLVTSAARRHFENGKLVPTHGDYPQAMRDLAWERGVRLIDLETATMALVQAAGEEGSKGIYCHVPSGHKNYPQGLADDSHLQYNGAVLFAKLFLEGMKGRLSAGTAAKGEDSETYMDLINAEDYVMNK